MPELIDLADQRSRSTKTSPTTVDAVPRWGLYPWFREHGVDLIHPEDLATVEALMPNGKVLHVLGEQDGFVRLAYGNTEFRARPALFREVTGDIHSIGEEVLLRDGQTGEVIGVRWHHQRSEPMYELRIGSKRKSRRYWKADFQNPEQ